MAAPKKAAGKSAGGAKKSAGGGGGGAFMKPMQPDEALGAVVGNEPMPRTEVTKRIWDYIRNNGFFGMLIPKEHGGLGFSAYAQSCVVTKIATRSLTAVAACSCATVHALLAHSSPTRRCAAETRSTRTVSSGAPRRCTAAAAAYAPCSSEEDTAAQ